MQLDDIHQLNSRSPHHGSLRPMTQSNASLERNKATMRNETFRQNVNYVMKRNEHAFKKQGATVNEYMDEIKNEETNEVGRRQQLSRKI